MTRSDSLAVAACISIGISSLIYCCGYAGAFDDDPVIDGASTTAPEQTLTVTEALIAREIVRLGGDWEVPWEPRLIGFLGEEFQSKHYEMLTHLPTVTLFAVTDGVVDDFSLSCLSQVDQLQWLHIKYSDVRTDSFSLLRSNRQLKELLCDGITLPAGAVAQIATLTQIEQLEFSEVEFNENVVESLASMRNLKHLGIFDCIGIDDEEIAAIKAALPNLEN